MVQISSGSRYRTLTGEGKGYLPAFRVVIAEHFTTGSWHRCFDLHEVLAMWHRGLTMGEAYGIGLQKKPPLSERLFTINWQSVILR